MQESYWEVIHDWIKENLKSFNSIKAIGSGGNINKIASMLGKAKGKSIHYNDIKSEGAEKNMFDGRPHLGLPSYFKGFKL